MDKVKPDDRDYFSRRALEEEKAAAAATSLKARWKHEELAILYWSRANAAGFRQPPAVADTLGPGDIAL
jgi:hypothetical protein